MSSKEKPIFANVFGQDWDKLPAIMHKHYANRGFCQDVVTAKGKMTIEISPLLWPVLPIMRLSKTLVGRQGKDIFVQVDFRSKENSNHFCLDRRFVFKDKAEEKFYSCMEPQSDNEVIEWTAIGIGWHASFSVEHDMVVMSHKGFVFKLFGRMWRLPVWLFGCADAKEWALDENRFDMSMTLSHPILGRLYSYRGSFEIR